MYCSLHFQLPLIPEKDLKHQCWKTRGFDSKDEFQPNILLVASTELQFCGWIIIKTKMWIKYCIKRRHFYQFLYVILEHKYNFTHAHTQNSSNEIHSSQSRHKTQATDSGRITSRQMQMFHLSQILTKQYSQPNDNKIIYKVLSLFHSKLCSLVNTVATFQYMRTLSKTNKLWVTFSNSSWFNS